MAPAEVPAAEPAALPVPALSDAGSGRPSISCPCGSITNVRLKGSAGSDCSQLFSASGPLDSKARAACAYSCPRCTHGRSVRCAVALTATVTVPTRISANAAQKARKILQYKECMRLALAVRRGCGARRDECECVARAAHTLYIHPIRVLRELAAQV